MFHFLFFSSQDSREPLAITDTLVCLNFSFFVQSFGLNFSAVCSQLSCFCAEFQGLFLKGFSPFETLSLVPLFVHNNLSFAGGGSQKLFMVL